jgi:cell division protein FtsA
MIVGLDIGTTRVRAVVGEYNEKGLLEIIGVGSSPSTGLRRGVVVNIESTLRSVAQAVEAAEMMSGREVHGCYVGIAGAHIEGINSRGVVAVTGKGREIAQEDIDRVIEAARAIVIPMDREVLHVIPQTYVVDDQKGIKDPRDMIGVRLEAEVHIITGSVTTAQNLVKCVNRAGFKVEDLILQSLSAARAVLSNDEKDLGTMLVDLGGGTTDILVFADGAPYFTGVIPVGGTQVTGDLSIMLNTPIDVAERIKLESGCCYLPLVERDEEIILPGVGGRPPLTIPRANLATIIQPRMEEILKMAREKVESMGYLRKMGGGIVLTGGGSMMPGAAELAHEVFGLPVRIGNPVNLGGLVDQYRSPLYSTAVGLVLFGAERVTVEGFDQKQREREKPQFFGKIADWVKKEFF